MDPFVTRPRGSVARRPRVLSYAGRWGRARRWLPPDALHVLDVGCAFGYGSAAIAAPGPPGRAVVGVEPDPAHLAKAHEHFPWITVLPGEAQNLPVPDGVADAVTLLDVIEHVDHAEVAIEEARRVVRPGGVAIISVPHRGLLWRLDSLNVYAAARRRWPHLPPLDAATESGGHEHRHYSVADLEAVLAPYFTVDRVTRTGIGLQEFVHLALLTLSVGLRQERLTRALQILHLVVYLIDDLLPLGRFGYHLTVRAQAATHNGGASGGDAA
ncbi:MAG: methyltransferase domain-containing protein [Solirubrobacteraceae bacterium]